MGNSFKLKLHFRSGHVLETTVALSLSPAQEGIAELQKTFGKMDFFSFTDTVTKSSLWVRAADVVGWVAAAVEPVE